MQKIKVYKNGFTLVELIIVITILAILASISFVGYSGYLADARDSTRLSSIKNIGTKLEIYQTQIGTYPNPDNEIKITSSGNIISYQGEYTSNIGGKIGADGFSDPLDGSNLLYGVKSDKKSYQLLGYAEKILGLSLNSQTYADSGDKSEMGIISGGNKLGILLDDKNIGVNYLGSDVDIYNTTTTYNYVFGERDKVSGTGGVLVENIPNKSCKNLFKAGVTTDGVYTINPTGTNEIKAYCNMTQKDGGWTSFYGTNRKNVNTLLQTQIPGKINYGEDLSDLWSNDLSGMNFSQLMIEIRITETNRIFQKYIVNSGSLIFSPTTNTSYYTDNIVNDEGDCSFRIRWRGRQLWEVGINDGENGAMDAHCAVGVGDSMQNGKRTKDIVGMPYGINNVYMWYTDTTIDDIAKSAIFYIR